MIPRLSTGGEHRLGGAGDARAAVAGEDVAGAGLVLDDPQVRGEVLYVAGQVAVLSAGELQRGRRVLLDELVAPHLCGQGAQQRGGQLQERSRVVQGATHSDLTMQRARIVVVGAVVEDPHRRAHQRPGDGERNAVAKLPTRRLRHHQRDGHVRRQWICQHRVDHRGQLRPRRGRAGHCAAANLGETLRDGSGRGGRRVVRAHRQPALALPHLGAIIARSAARSAGGKRRAPRALGSRRRSNLRMRR